MTLPLIRKCWVPLACAMSLMGGAATWAQTTAPVTPQEQERSLDKGAMADVTPQQRYNSAMREAHGGLKIALAECRQQAAGAERKACEAEAQQRFKADMAQARELQKNPSARPVDVKGEPIRSTETTTVIRQ